MPAGFLDNKNDYSESAFCWRQYNRRNLSSLSWFRYRYHDAIRAYRVSPAMGKKSRDRLVGGYIRHCSNL